MRCVPTSTIGVARYATASTRKGATSAGASSRGASPARRAFHARTTDHAQSASASPSRTGSLPSQKRSDAYAPKKSTFAQSAGAVPSSVGSRYMFGSHTY